MNKKIEYVTIQVPVGSFICPPRDMERRIKAAKKYMDSCTQCFNEPRYYTEDVIKMIEIAAGKEVGGPSPD